MCSRVPSWILNLILIILCAVWMWSSCLYFAVMKSAITLEEGSALFKMWKNKPLIMYKKLYFFNVTNADDFMLGSKMNVDEVGPLTYSLEWRKTNFHWHGEGIMTYRRKTVLEFVPEMSAADENARIYTLNMSMVEESMQKGHLDLSDRNYLIVNTTIRDFMDSRSLSWLNRLSCSTDGNYIVDTGRNLVRDLNSFREWNTDRLPDFIPKRRNAFVERGSIDVGPPLENEEIVFRYFESELCRCLTFILSSYESINGLISTRFEISPHINGFDFLDVGLELKCATRNKSNCCPISPAVISLPHFYSAIDSNFQVSGLKPNGSKHVAFVDVEPETGITTHFAVRYQINVKLSINKNWTYVPKGVYPLVWVEDLGFPSDECDWFLFFYVKVPHYVMYSVASWVMFFALAGVALFSLTRQYFEEDIRFATEEEPLLENLESRDYLSINEKEHYKKSLHCSNELSSAHSSKDLYKPQPCEVPQKSSGSVGIRII